VEQLDRRVGPVMKASWIAGFTITPPMGITPLVTILAKVIMSGVTPKRCAPKGCPSRPKPV